MANEFPITVPIHVDDALLMALSASNNHLKMERNRKGELIVMSPSGTRVSKYQFRIASILDEWNQKNGLGIGFESQAGFHLPDGSVMSPDISWIKLERWNSLSEEEQNGFAPLCPDFVIEVVSPSDSIKQQQEKMLLWMQNGCRLGWLIQPAEKNVWVYREGQKEAEHLQGLSQQLSGEQVLPDFILDLSSLKF